jgi:hypothetical protein
VAQLSFVLTYVVTRWVYAVRSVEAWDDAVRCSSSCFVDFQSIGALSQVRERHATFTLCLLSVVIKSFTGTCFYCM